uniref:Uncharacterized protein n=1 Tax=Mycobacterium riyadhense TaxID=486698 RepID=A0A653EWV2_9MYCO|nr:hypothetical protein BIN_B_04203 [Mycobacterium riyadhense]
MPLGLIALGRSDEVGVVYGDSRGSANIRARRGETHIESLLHRFYTHTFNQPASSDVITQLTYVATGYRHRMLIIVISDEPDLDARLDRALQQLRGLHDLMWAMVSDMPAVGSVEGERDGYDVATGGYVLNGATSGLRIISAYRRREAERVAQLRAGFVHPAGLPPSPAPGGGGQNEGANVLDPISPDRIPIAGNGSAPPHRPGTGTNPLEQLQNTLGDADSTGTSGEGSQTH